MAKSLTRSSGMDREEIDMLLNISQGLWNAYIEYRERLIKLNKYSLTQKENND